jgi:curved DNA-binding protein CbpA
MGIWERLETVIKSYVNGNDGTKTTRKYNSPEHDPDFDAAYEELDDFLKGKNSGEKINNSASAGTFSGSKDAAPKKRAVPEEIRKDLAELGLGPEATAEECKEAYKKLLKIHHPDRHTGHEGNMKKATEKSARVNAAYDRLEKWFKIINNN